ncbi:hypothetical protein Tco_0016390 [Tanacetum coccineum]
MASTRAFISKASKRLKINIIPPKQLFVDLTQDDTKTPSPKHQLSSPSAPNAPSKTLSTKGTSSSSIDYTPKSLTSSTSPSINGYLNSPTSPPPRVPPPPPTQENASMYITLALSPITPLDVQFDTPSPSPHVFGYPITWNLLEAHGDSIEDIVQTQASTNEGGSNPPDSVAVQLAAIAAKLETIDVLKADIATPKAQANSRGRSFGSRNDNGGVLGSPNNIFDLTTRSTFPRSAEEIHALLEADDVTEEPPDTQEVNLDENPSEVAEISLHAIFGKSQPTTMKVHGTLNSTELTSQMVAPFGVQIGNGDVIRCSKVCRDLSIQLGGLKVVQDFDPFSIGGADLVLGI